MNADTLLQSFAFYGGRGFFISTARRTFSTYAGQVNGLETFVWEWSPEKSERGDLIATGGGIEDHLRFCRSLVASGNPE